MIIIIALNIVFDIVLIIISAHCLIAGKTISINVVAVMARAAQESAPSKTIHITCPRRPAAPTISQQPSYKRGCVLLAWDKPRGHPDTTEETISAYAIYVDGQWHGEVKASRMGDQQGYQFFLTDLAPEQSYDVSVKVRDCQVETSKDTSSSWLTWPRNRATMSLSR